MDDPDSFGGWIRRRRKALDLTREALAEQVGCAVVTIRKIESDERRPSRQIAERLADCLAIPPADRAAFLQAARAELAVSRLAQPPLPDTPPLPASRPRAPTPPALKGYILGEQIGAGGFGAVYKANQPGVGREVAIKIIRPEFANHPEFIRRFEAEAQLVARLEHPHIVPLYDYWRAPDGAYLVMRYIRGGSVQTALSGPWPLERCARLLADIGPALDFAHRHGVIHRDIKPANLLLDTDGNAYLADFGIAKDLRDTDHDAQTRPDALVGSPDYLSPEQIRAEPLSPATDIYGLGILLYVLLAGAHPLGGLAPAERLVHQLTTPLPPILARRPELPPAVEAIIQRATAKSPAERYPDVARLLADWQLATAPPPRTGDRPVARHPAAPPDDSPTETLALPAENPYKGLRAFVEGDQTDFFGRETLIHRLIERLGEIDQGDGDTPVAGGRFLVVVGPSGSGKSSVVRAGLIPALRHGALPGSERWFISDMLPGAHPLEELEAALLRIAVNPPEQLLGQLREDERGLARAIKRVLPADPAVELVLLIDQFEEIFTLLEDNAARTHFLALLVAAVGDPRARLRLIVTLRADFYDRPLLYPAFAELIRARTELALPLTATELRRAIIGPAARVGVSADADLVAEMISDVSEQPGALPLLQYALTELYEARSSPSLTLSDYRAGGGVSGALARRADSIYARLSPAEQAAARQLFLRLITPGEGVEDTRRRIRLSELALIETYERSTLPPPTPNPAEPSPIASYGRSTLPPPTPNPAEPSPIASYGRSMLRPNTSDPAKTSIKPPGPSMPQDHPVLARYAAYRLLTFDHDPITREPTVEVAHEALIRSWGRLRAWLAASRDELRAQRRLAAAAAEWQAAGRDPSYLAGGSRLAQFTALDDGGSLILNQAEQAFLEASQTAAAQEAAAQEARRERELEVARRLAATESARAEQQQQAANQLRRRALALAGALALALILAGAALYFGLAANRNARTAQEAGAVATSRELAAAAISNLEVDPERSILLALRGLAVAPTRQAGEALHRAVMASRIQRVIRPLPDATTPLVFALFSPDNTLLAISQLRSDGPSQTSIVDQAGNIRYTIPGFSAATSWSTDRHLVTEHPSGEQLTLTTWELMATGTRQTAVITLPERFDNIYWYQLSPDYGLIALGRRNGQMVVYRMADGRELFTAGGGEISFFNFAFSPDGGRLAAATFNGRIMLWRLAANEPDGATSFTPDAATDISPLTGHSDQINALSFSPDGNRLASAGIDGTARIWDLTLDKAALAPLLSASAGDPRLRHTLRGHTNELTFVAWSPDGARLASAGRDRQILVWDAAVGERLYSLIGHTGLVNTVIFSPDGATIASGSEDGSTRIWDAGSAYELRAFSVTPPTSSNYWVPMELSRDGRRLIAANPAVVAPPQIFDPATGAALVELAVGDDRIAGVALSANGSLAATASSATPGEATAAPPSVAVWDVTNGALIRRFAAQQPFLSVALSPDGAQVAAVALDAETGVGTVHLWDVATGTEHVLPGSGTAYESAFLAFSPDGRRLAAGAMAGTDLPGFIDIWEVATGRHQLRIDGHETRIFSLAFDPDGERLASSSRDGTAKIWDATSGALLQTFVGHTSTVMGVAWHPDGAQLATAAYDGTIKLWDAATGAEILNLASPSPASNLAYSPDGTQLYATSVDGVARVYLLNLNDLIALARSRVTRSLTLEECRVYLHTNACPEGPQD